MTKSLRSAGIVLFAMLFAVLTSTAAFAAVTIPTAQTVKLINNKTLPSAGTEMASTAIVESSIVTYENSPGGYFTFKIPTDVKLCGNQYHTSPKSPLAKTTTVLGSSSSPKSLFLKATTNTNAYSMMTWAPGTSAQAAFITLYSSASGLSGSEHALFSVFSYASSQSFGRGYGYTSADLLSAGTDSPLIAEWGTFGTHDSATLAAKTLTRAKVGQIYYDSTNDEIVVTLSLKGRTDASYLETLFLNHLTLAPKTAGTTGDISVTFSDGDASGNAPKAGFSAVTAKVATLTDQAVKLTASTTPPTIPAGKVEGQAMGQIKITLIGDATANNNVLTVELDNGAKFHTGAADASTNKLGSANPTSILINSGTSWKTWDSTGKGESLAVNSSGKLVITLGSRDLSDTNTILLPASTTGEIIDTSGVSADATITATVSGTGTNMSGVSATAAVATVKVTGTTVSFKDDTTSGYKTIYTGRKTETISEKLQVSETAPTSLLKGGTLKVELNLGAKFGSQDTISLAESTATGYTDTTLAFPSSVSTTTAATSFTTTVSESSANNAGTYFIDSFSFDTTSATAGDLIMTVSGTAGASGNITMATLMDATTTTVATPITVVPGSSVNLPDIVITENKAGALEASTIGLKFPTGFTISDSGVTVAATANGTAVSGVTWGDVDSSDATYAYLTVSSQSASASGAYVITISGLTATTTSSVTSGDTSFTIAGGNTTYSASSGFDANSYAKPTKESVIFGSTVSATVPYADTPTVVGTNVTQTFIAAGNDIGKPGDIYIYTKEGEFYDKASSTWSTTEAVYQSTTLGTHDDIYYDVDGLATGTNIYIGYGVGTSNTATTMSTNGTVALAYTTASTVEVGKDAGAGTAEQNVNDAIELYLNITNDDGYDPATDFVYEWLVFGATVGGADAGLFFYAYDGTTSSVSAYDASLDLTTVTYQFDHTSDTFKVSDLNLGTLGLSAGDQFWYGYVYGLTGFDLADTSTWSLENYTFITAK